MTTTLLRMPFQWKHPLELGSRKKASPIIRHFIRNVESISVGVHSLYLLFHLNLSQVGISRCILTRMYKHLQLQQTGLNFYNLDFFPSFAQAQQDVICFLLLITWNKLLLAHIPAFSLSKVRIGTNNVDSSSSSSRRRRSRCYIAHISYVTLLHDRKL